MGAAESRTSKVTNDEISQQVPRDLRSKGLGPHLDKLPNELLFYLFSFVDIVSLCRLGQINPLLTSFTSDKFLWQEVFQELKLLRKDTEKWRNTLSQRNITEFHIIDEALGLTINQKRQGWKIFGSIEDSAEFLKTYSQPTTGVFICCRGSWKKNFTSPPCNELVLYGDTDLGNIEVTFPSGHLQTSYHFYNIKVHGTIIGRSIDAWNTVVELTNSSFESSTFENVEIKGYHSKLTLAVATFNNCTVADTNAVIGADHQNEFKKSKSSLNNSSFSNSVISISPKAMVYATGCKFTKSFRNAVSVSGIFYSEQNTFIENPTAVEWAKGSSGHLKSDKFTQNTKAVGISSASPEISNCQFENTKTASIHISNNSKALITQCIFTNNSGTCIYVTSDVGNDLNNNNNALWNRKKVPKPVIKDNMINSNDGSGIICAGRCKGIICDNQIKNNKKAGIVVSDPFEGSGYNNVLVGNLASDSGFEVPQVMDPEDQRRSLTNHVIIPDSDNRLNVLLLGNGGVGKTSYCGQYVTGCFIERWDPTLEENWPKAVSLNGKTIIMDWMESPRVEQFTAMRDLYLKNSHMFVLMYSIVSRSSFNDLIDYVDNILRVKDVEMHTIPIVLVGTKSDLEAQRVVTYEEGLAFATQRGWPFIEISTKYRSNVEEMASMLYKEMLFRRYVLPSLKNPSNSEIQMPALPPILLSPSTMVQDIAQLINKKSCSDVTFVVESKPVYANMLIILARCPKMADGIQKGSVSCEIEDGITTETFLEFMTYVHTGIRKFKTFEQVSQLLKLARSFNLRHLTSACDKFLHQSIQDDGNCKDIVSRTFQILFNEDAYSDVVFEFPSGKKIFSHRVILMARCSLFENVLPTNINQKLSSNMKKVTIHVGLWSYEAYYNFIEFMYADKTELNAKSVVEVLKLANQYQMKRLVSLCECFIAKFIDVQNAAAIYSVAWQNEASELKSFDGCFISSHFSAVSKTKAYQNLTSTIEQELVAVKLEGNFIDTEAYRLCRPQDYATNPLII